LAEHTFPANRLLTLGHGTLTIEAFGDLVTAAAVDVVVDVRRYPGSHRHPHFVKTEMTGWLTRRGVGYAALPALGGRRRPIGHSINGLWRNKQFQAYADHMATDEFRDGVETLLGVLASQSAAVMCAESVWWRCHRRLLADHLVLVRQVSVGHLFHDGRVTPHQPTAGAAKVGDHVEYPAA
jgi:uncharacterized protein (DUF488 family)